MNFIKLIVVFSCLFIFSISQADTVWTSYKFSGSKFKFKSSTSLPITESGKSLLISVGNTDISIKDSGMKKLRTYSLNKKVKAFRKELRKRKIRLLRLTGPVKARISRNKITIWEYQFFYLDKGNRYSHAQYYFKCGKKIFKLSYTLDKAARFNRKLKFNLKRVIYNLRCQ